MSKLIFAGLLLSLIGFQVCVAQVPLEIGVRILRVEDARRYNTWLEDTMRSSNAEIRKRAALAAGRIGREEAIPALTRLLESDNDMSVRTMAAFALGETESIKAADAILSALSRAEALAAQAETRAVASVPATKARLLEAAGKIAAANAKEEKSKQLGAAIVKTLKDELASKLAPDALTIRLGLTAVLRARPAGSEETVRKFLSYTDPAIVADALNTLARLRAKNANRDARDLLATSPNPIVRANAARVLGAAEDKEAVDVLIKAATSDSDERVRVSAIRSLGTLKNNSSADALLDRGEVVLANYIKLRKPGFIPVEQNEFIEIMTALGRILVNSSNERPFKLFARYVEIDPMKIPEIYTALFRINAGYRYSGPPIKSLSNLKVKNWHEYSTMAQSFGELANLQPTSDDGKKLKKEAPDLLYQLAADQEIDPMMLKAYPDVLRAYANFKTENLESLLREALSQKDVFIRATAAELLAENAPSSGVRLQIENAFKKALTTDKHDNDAQLAMLDAMAKINKAASLDTIYMALDAPDYLVRKKAFELLDDKELTDKNPYVNSVLTLARQKHRDEVAQYDPKTGTKLGQVLNTDADYRRALSRKNGRTKAMVTTEKGTFTIDLLPEDAPLTVDNFVKLARSNYFNGLEVHRVVPNFVMQDGDPRGDGNGGPGWSIRCEINMVPYERGAVGMALSGKDTGGSQWFVTHSPQPHLDGGYTVFGRVNETGMKVVDKIVRGDKILSIRILER